jgi:two-component system NarL family response regulator
MKTVAIVEDDPELRAGLAKIFQSLPDFTLGPLAGSAEELLRWLDQDRPHIDLALVDLGLPGMSGQELIAKLTAEHPSIACVAHTVFDDPKAVFASLRAGAAGYLLKGCSGPELLQSLRTLNEGGAPLTPRIARLLLGEFREEPGSPLSDRELEVLAHLAQGLSYKEIAGELVLSSHTVHTHVKHIYEKLQVRGRRDALAKARRQGWLD